MGSNVLQMRVSFPYNSKVFRTKAVPAGNIPGCTGMQKTQAWSLSEEKSE